MHLHFACDGGLKFVFEIKQNAKFPDPNMYMYFTWDLDVLNVEKFIELFQLAQNRGFLHS
jgi:hypothetical protein